MSKGDGFLLDVARRYTGKYLESLRFYCEVAHYMGSVRRETPIVHDVEILVLPLLSSTTDMFGNLLGSSLLEENIHDLVKTWGAKILEGGKIHKTIKLPEGIMLDLYVATPESFAVEMVIKTGPAEFSHKCVTIRRMGGYLPSDCRIKNGWQVYRGNRVIPMANEDEFLSFLGFGWIEPKDRHGKLIPGVSTETKESVHASH